MRILYLCKRRYMGKDVIADRYARLYEQPAQLARRGHQVLGLCLSYRAQDEIEQRHEAVPGELRWIGLAPGPIHLGVARWPARALAIARAFRPDVVIGASDAPMVILAAWLARRTHTPLAVDLYDHFETFGLSRLPGVVSLYRRALRQAAVVSCVSTLLADLVRSQRGGRESVLALPSTVDRGIFRPTDRGAARAALGLPAHARLVGSAGALAHAKGIGVLYQAFAAMAPGDPALHMVLAGPVDPACTPPDHPRVHYLGVLPHDQAARLFSALDVAVVYLRDTPYGRYSFPQKAYEIAACGVPMAVASVGAMRTLFADTPQVLYAADDAEDLVRCLRAQLDDPVVPAMAIPDWAELARPLEAALQAACASPKA